MRRNIYTNPDLAKKIISTIDLPRDAKIADLGCGDGVFLTSAIQSIRATEPDMTPSQLSKRVFGIDIESQAVSETVANLNNLFPAYDTSCLQWNIKCGNALTIHENTKYDVIVGNPPWTRVLHLDSETKALAKSDFTSARGAYDLYHLFVEKSLRILKPGGILSLIVPQTINYGPASRPVRILLDSQGEWSLSQLSKEDFHPHAVIRPSLLNFRKHKTEQKIVQSKKPRTRMLGSIAHVTTGVPTGSDKIFLVDLDTINKLKLEDHRLRSVLRGRDVGTEKTSRSKMKLVWPYYLTPQGKWIIDDLSDSPNTKLYLESHRKKLASRPKLASYLKNNPDKWYRFIDPNRHGLSGNMRIALPDIFQTPCYEILTDPEVVVMNSCFQILPKTGQQDKLMNVIHNSDFWASLKNHSRALEKNYHRTSVSELLSLPLPG